MRNSNRLDNFYTELCRIHKERFPDQRFGQLMYNFFGWVQAEKQKDIFFPEEDEMLNLLREYCGVDEIFNHPISFNDKKG